MTDELKYWVWLNSLHGISPKKRLQLVQHFGDPRNVWSACEEELRILPFLSPGNIVHLLDKNIKKDSEKHLENIHKFGINLITIYDELYPEYLRKIYDPPIVLYIKGTIRRDELAVAVVGSRKATYYGLRMAEDIAYELARNGITVVSGMARGIDSYAHNGALRTGARTIAVLGCGLDIVYPRENKELMEKIIGSGAVISEYVPGVEPSAYNFPARNRIISGFSMGVVVIEAGEHSGSLITANFALDQGREVFAVPGNANSLNSVGTNKLIKDGAKLVTGIEDILEELFFLSKVKRKVPGKSWEKPMNPLYESLCGEEKVIAGCLALEPLHIDILAQKSGISIQLVSATLVSLELKGIVEQMPGKMFRLKE